MLVGYCCRKPRRLLSNAGALLLYARVAVRHLQPGPHSLRGG
jgi:hypothetical protein